MEGKSKGEGGTERGVRDGVGRKRGSEDKKGRWERRKQRDRGREKGCMDVEKGEERGREDAYGGTE